MTCAEMYFYSTINPYISESLIILKSGCTSRLTLECIVRPWFEGLTSLLVRADPCNYMCNSWRKYLNQKIS